MGQGRREPSPDLDIPLTNETYRAMEGIRFIAAHLKNEDDYSEVGQGVAFIESTKVYCYGRVTSHKAIIDS